MNLSRRSIERRVRRATGLTLGTIKQIDRAHRATALLDAGATISEVIIEADYADQVPSAAAPWAMTSCMTSFGRPTSCFLAGTTYEGFAPVWPTIDDAAGFARKLNAMRKYVASNTLAEATWTNTSILSGDVAASVRQLKAEDGGDILVYGSARLVHSLLPQGLVDKVHMLIYPTVLGRGTRLFPANYARHSRTTPCC